MKKVEEKFIIEVNKGIYLRIINLSSGICDFTDNPNIATSFLVGGNMTAKKYAKNVVAR